MANNDVETTMAKLLTALRKLKQMQPPRLNEEQAKRATLASHCLSELHEHSDIRKLQSKTNASWLDFLRSVGLCISQEALFVVSSLLSMKDIKSLSVPSRVQLLFKMREHGPELHVQSLDQAVDGRIWHGRVRTKKYREKSKKPMRRNSKYSIANKAGQEPSSSATQRDASGHDPLATTLGANFDVASPNNNLRSVDISCDRAGLIRMLAIQDIRALTEEEVIDHIIFTEFLQAGVQPFITIKVTTAACVRLRSRGTLINSAQGQIDTTRPWDQLQAKPRILTVHDVHQLADEDVVGVIVLIESRKAVHPPFVTIRITHGKCAKMSHRPPLLGMNDANDRTGFFTKSETDFTRPSF